MNRISYNIYLSISLIYLSYLSPVILYYLPYEVPSELFNYIIASIILIMLAIITKSIPFSKQNIKPIVAILSLFLIIFFYYPSSNSIYYADSKILLIFYLILVKIFFLAFINTSIIKNNIHQFVKSAAIFSLITIWIYLLSSFLFPNTGITENRLMPNGIENSIWFSRYISILLITIIISLRISKKLKLLKIITLIIGLLLMIASGSRGPLIALILSIQFYAILELKLKKNIIYYVLFIGAIFIFIVIFPDLRIFQIETSSNFYRNQELERSLHLISENIFGYGTGSYGVITIYEDIRYYPHNIFLEITIENGLLTLIWLVFLLLLTLKSYSKNNIFYFLFLVALINSNFSGDIPGNSDLFIFMVLAMIYKTDSREKRYDPLFVRT